MSNRFVTRSCGSGKVVAARIKSGSDLLRSLQEIVKEEEIKAGIILSGVGLLSKAKLRNCKSLPDEFPITDENRSFLSYETPLEILGVSGNISTVDGGQLVHAHLALSYSEEGKVGVIGGHLIKGCVVFGFAEIFILELTGIEMVKRFDEETKTHQLFA